MKEQGLEEVILNMFRDNLLKISKGKVSKVVVIIWFTVAKHIPDHIKHFMAMETLWILWSVKYNCIF